jgi:hypothetical protein
MSFQLCADFSIFPNNYVLGPAFSLAAMDFQDVAPPPSLVKEAGGARGLRFPDAGLRVDFPVVVQRVRLHIGQFAGGFTIEALDLAGVALSTFSMNTPGGFQVATLWGPDLVAVRLSGGDNEGEILSVCALIP